MIIARAPYRISFFGGSTDYPAWYREHPGAVLATSIDKYCYIFARWLPPFFEHKHRIVWSQTELTQTITEIQHPTVRACLEWLGFTEGIEIHHAADLPARAGMGTSSAFTVALLQALCALRGMKPTKMELASLAIHIEQVIIKENVGSQDQVMAAYGGFNRIDFGDDIKVTPVSLKPERLEELQSYLMLIYSGISRTASHLAGELIENIPLKNKELKAMYDMVAEGISILQGNGSIVEFGKLLHQGWELKKSLTEKTSPLYTDFVYEEALKAGAIGGKVLGAGGGGFMLLFVEPELQNRVDERLKLLRVPFKFENSGSEVIFPE